MSDLIPGQDLDWVEQELEKLSAFTDEGTKILADAGRERVDQNRNFQELMTNATLAGQQAQIKSYQGMAKSTAQLLGLGIKEQCLIMAPFEIAESAKELGKFLSTGDPMALLAAGQHGLAAALYLKAAGSSGGGGGGGGGSAGGGAGNPQEKAAAVEPARTATIIIEGAKRDANEMITLTSEELYKLVDSLNMKIKEGSVILQFA